ncbi:hypothetical protein [Spirochaeta dissipatitropha]
METNQRVSDSKDSQSDPDVSFFDFPNNARAVFVANTTNDENESVNMLFQLTDDGSISKISLDEVLIDSNAPIALVAGISEQALLIGFGYSISSISSAWLYTADSQGFFDLGELVTGFRSMTNYYKHPPLFQYDAIGGIYYLGTDQRIHRVDTSTEPPGVTHASPTGDREDFFEVTSTGFIAYRTWEGDYRIRHPEGALAHLPSRDFWRAPDGYIYLYHPHTDSEGEYQTIARVTLDNQGNVDFTWIESELQTSIWPPHMSLKAETKDRVFIVDEDRANIIAEVYNPDGVPRSLDFMPNFSSISHMTATSDRIIVSGFTDRFRTYFIDPETDIYEEISSLTNLDVRSIFPIENNSYIVNGLRLSDGKVVIGLLDSTGEVTVIAEEGDTEILYLTSW